MTSVAVLIGCMALLVSGMILFAVVAAVWWLDRYDREPVHLVLAVLLWGAAAAPLLTCLLNPLLGRGAALATGDVLGRWAAAVLMAPVLEEALKGVAVLGVVLLSDQFDNPTDGIVYGTAVGLGFAVTENVLYALGTELDPVKIVRLVGVRTFASSGLHALATAAFGGFLGVAYLSRGWVRRLAAGVAGFAVAVSLHAGWNHAVVRASLSGDTAPLARILIALPLVYALYLGVVAAFLHWEHRILRNELRDEVRLGVLPAWVADTVPYYWRRVRADWWPRRRERTVIARLLTRLAFRKHAVGRLPLREADLAGLEVVRLRQRIRSILYEGVKE